MNQNKGVKTTREIYKTVKKYDRQQFDAFCNQIYNRGYQDGRSSVVIPEPAEPEPSVSLAEIFEMLAEVKGIGPKKMEEIKVTFAEKFGEVLDAAR